MKLKANELPSSLVLVCSVDPEWQDLEAAAAADGKPKIPTFAIKAYTGGPMQLAGFYRPVVVDLAGMKAAAKSIPILRGHDDGKILGHSTEVTSDGKQLHVAGIVSAENRHSREVIAAARNGFPWQASIGASVIEFDNVREGQSTSVNGSTVKGPLLIARKWVLNEVSLLPRGADSKTSAKVAASVTSAKPVTLAQLHSRRKQ